MNDQITPSHRIYLKNIRKNKLCVIIFRILIAVLFIGGWEFFTRLKIIDAFVFSSPSRIIKCFTELAAEGIIFRHMGITISETLICFIIVIGAGMAVAMLMWRYRMIFKVAEPYFVLLNSLPKSALAPVLIVWLGNNIKTIIVAAVSVAVFGAILSIYTSFIETEPEKIKLMQTLGANRRQILFMLVIPSSLPIIYNTMKVNLGLSLVGVIIGEFLAARQGLGYMIIYATQTFKMDWVLLSIVILCILSVCMYQLINLLEKRGTGK